MMKGEARQTVRHAGGVAIQRVLMAAAGVALNAILPRVMGPDLFGKHSLIHSVAHWFTVFGGMGAASMMTRFVPDLVARGDYDGLRRLVSGFLTLRIFTGAFGALCYFAFCSLWLVRDVSPLALAIAGVALTARTVSNSPFTLFLGLNQAARWEASALLGRILMLPFVYAGFRWQGLAGAAAGMLAADLCVLALGLWWSRGYVRWDLMRVDREFLAPYIRFSASFFAGNFFFLLFQQSGVAVVKVLSGDYAQAGFFALAFQIYLAATMAVWRPISAFGPLLSSIRAKSGSAGDPQIRAWVERLLRLSAIVTASGCAFAFALSAPAARLLFGRAYEPVAPLLPLLALAVHTFTPGGVPRLLAVTFSAARVSAASAGLQLAGFLLTAVLLVPRYGSLGGAVAVLLGSLLFAAFGTWRIRPLLTYSLGGWMQVTALALVCSPALWWWTEAPVAIRLTVFHAAFCGLLVACGLLRMAELRAAIGVLRSKRPEAEAN